MLQKVSELLSRFRWYLALVILAALLFSAVVYLIRPVTIALLLESKKQHAVWQDINNSEELPKRIAELDNQIVRLYDALQEGEGKLDFNEAQLLRRLYTVADSIGFTVSKVEMGDAVSIPGGREYPIEIGGTGGYNAVGKLISRIENLNRFTRVTYCTMKKEPQYNTLSFFVEFMVMEEL